MLLLSLGLFIGKSSGLRTIEMQFGSFSNQLFIKKLLPLFSRILKSLGKSFNFFFCRLRFNFLLKKKMLEKFLNDFFNRKYGDNVDQKINDTLSKNNYFSHLHKKKTFIHYGVNSNY